MSLTPVPTGPAGPGPTGPAGPGPGGPAGPNGPQPSGPEVTTDDLMHLADAVFGAQSPARQGTPSTAVAAAVGFPLSPGGPVQDSGREKSARPDGGAPGVPQLPAVAADVPGKVRECRGRVVGADGAATFTTPNTRVPLRFGAGEHRLVGLVEALLTPDS